MGDIAMPMDKKFWISFGVIFVIAMLIGFVNHGLLLAGDYEPLMGSVMRTEEEQMGLFHFQFIAHLSMAFGIAWLYRVGHDPAKPWLGQGLRFGVAFALAATIPIFLIYHAVAMFPLMLAVKQSVFDGIGMLVIGAAAAFVNK